MADNSVRLRSQVLQGSAEMPNWRPDSKHHQPVSAPGLGSPRAPGLTIIPHYGEDNGLWDPIRNCGEVDTGRRRRGDRFGIHQRDGVIGE